jgi:hypothetical protein
MSDVSDAPEAPDESDAPDVPDVPESRPLMSRLRDAVRITPYEPPQARHRLTLRSVQPAEDLGPFSSSVDDVLQVPADLEPWTPGEGDEVPWELREERGGQG